jgi:tRNA(His) 5'-end guanylyltransferase
MAEKEAERLGRMAEFETGPGQSILPEVHVVLRLEGDRFGRLSSNPELQLERPFDPRFGKWLLQVASHVMNKFPQARFAYVGADEISLLFGLGTDGFGPGGFRFAIRVAAQAGARLSLLVGEVATFNPRLYQLPHADWVVRFFAWRQGALLSQAIDRYCRSTLQRSGLDEGAVRRVLSDLSDSEKREVLHEHGLDFESLPLWQRRGVLVSRNLPGNGGAPLLIDTTLPEGVAYEEVVRRIAAGAAPA